MKAGEGRCRYASLHCGHLIHNVWRGFAPTLAHSLQDLILEKKGMERVAEAVHQGKMVVAMDDVGWRLEFANDVAASLAGKGTK